MHENNGDNNIEYKEDAYLANTLPVCLNQLRSLPSPFRFFGVHQWADWEQSLYVYIHRKEGTKNKQQPTTHRLGKNMYIYNKHTT